MVDYVGRRFKNNAGFWATVTEYANHSNVTIRFDKPYSYKVNVTTGCLKTGKFKNLNAPSILGWGITEGNNRSNPLFIHWGSMLTRVLCPKYHLRNPSYIDSDICLGWQKFTVFEEWALNQVYKSDWQLDKDWLYPKNNLYSPDTCIFVPKEVNLFLGDSERSRVGNPIGVCYDKDRQQFRAYITENHKLKHLGLFDNVIDANEVYCIEKEKQAIRLARKWKHLVDKRLYTAILNYKVSKYVD